MSVNARSGDTIWMSPIPEGRRHHRAPGRPRVVRLHVCGRRHLAELFICCAAGLPIGAGLVLIASAVTR